MTERGQKIFEIVVWAVIIISIIVGIRIKVNSVMNPPLTQAEWETMLVENFGNDLLLDLDNDNRYMTGEDAVLTVMKTIGVNNVEYMTGQTISRDEDFINIAVKEGIIDKDLLDEEISAETAKNILDKSMQFYFDIDSYPEYYEIDYVCDVVDTTNWEIDSFDDENNVVYVSSIEQIPTPGQVVLIRDDYGIAKPRSVKECRESEDGVYKISVERLSDPSALYSDIDFSGKADFSYLLNASEGNSPEMLEEMEEKDSQAKSINYFDTFRPMVAHAAKTKEFSSKVDLELGGTVTAKVDHELNDSYSYNSYMKVKDEDSESKYSVGVNDKGKITLKAERNDVALEAEYEADKAGGDDEFEFKRKAERSFSYKVKLSDLQVAASYCTKGSKDDKFVDVRVTSDVELEWSISGNFEGQVPIAELEVPIACTAGLVSVNVRVYLIVTASGEVSLVYTMEDVYVGMHVASDGFTVPHGRNKAKDRLDINVKAAVSAGLGVELAISIGDWLDTFEYDIIDPGVQVMVEASAETLPNNEGFENYPKCVQISMAAPTAEFVVSAGKDSLIYELLDFFDLTAKTSYKFITADNAPFKKELHIETELDGAMNVIEGSKDFCTHVKQSELEVDVEAAVFDPIENAKKKAEEAAKKKAEEAKRKAQEEFEKALEEAIEKWFMENCEEC